VILFHFCFTCIGTAVKTRQRPARQSCEWSSGSLYKCATAGDDKEYGGGGQSLKWRRHCRNDTKINDLDLCLGVVSRSCQPLRYIRRWISRKPLQIEAWFQRTTNSKWHMGYQMVTWPMTSLHLTPDVLWGSTVGYPSDSLASCLPPRRTSVKHTLSCNSCTSAQSYTLWCIAPLPRVLTWTKRASMPTQLLQQTRRISRILDRSTEMHRPASSGRGNAAVSKLLADGNLALATL